MRVKRAFSIPVGLMLACAILGTGWSAGEEEARGTGLSIGNEFIRIRVNPGPAEAGRFAVDTTGGDPSRSSDDNAVLIYGSSDPWTSYTTVLLDGEAMAFGGATSRRAGRDAPVGAPALAPQVQGDRVVCGSRLGDIEVRQELSFARSPTTRVKDAALISYQVTNRGRRPHSVGLRVVLDTMLGANDGAPLRAGDRAINTATRLRGGDIPDYWQAFDSLSRPAVISQGTLRGPGLSPPDRLEMVDWGTLADAAWEFEFPEGADFTRRGEAEQDTAAALYWEPAPLAPGESRTYATLYGVGGVSLSPAQLSLGVTAPTEVDYRYEETRPFGVVAYVENSGGFESRGTVCTLDLGRGLELAEGGARVGLGVLKPGETRQSSWKVVPTGEATGALKMVVVVASQNLESNRVEREVVVNSPPQLTLAIAAPKALQVTGQNRYSPNPFEVRATAANVGAQTARNLVVSLALPEGLKALDEGKLTQVAEQLPAEGTSSFVWRVRATGMPTGQLALLVSAMAAGARPVEGRHVVRVPWLTPELRVHPDDQTVPETTDGQPTLVPISVRLAPAREFHGGVLSVAYDPAVLEPLYVSRGEAFVEGGRLLSPWSGGRAEPGRMVGIGGRRGEAPPLNSAEVTLFTIVFMAKGPGETDIVLAETALVGPEAETVEHRAVGGHITVQGLEERE